MKIGTHSLNAQRCSLESILHSFSEFVGLVRQLRAPGGCPWDREQTFTSLIPFVIEEAYELVDALESNNAALLEEELGDVLLHVVMIGLMAEEAHLTTLEKIITSVHQKMIRRHPHVFGGKDAKTSDEVLIHWDAIKSQESEGSQALLASIPKQLPALFQALKIQKKLAKKGFDWPTLSGTLDKVQEEWGELQAELSAPEIDMEKVEQEFGDLLFSMVNVARKLKINPELSLKKTTQKVRDRISFIENSLSVSGTTWEAHSLEDLEILWENAKHS